VESKKVVLIEVEDRIVVTRGCGKQGGGRVGESLINRY
jgi:hypothetical protein